jgi:hypothetical protein
VSGGVVGVSGGGAARGFARGGGERVCAVVGSRIGDFSP